MESQNVRSSGTLGDSAPTLIWRQTREARRMRRALSSGSTREVKSHSGELGGARETPPGHPGASHANVCQWGVLLGENSPAASALWGWEVRGQGQPGRNRGLGGCSRVSTAAGPASVTVLGTAGRELGHGRSLWGAEPWRSIYNWKGGWEEMSHSHRPSAPGPKRPRRGPGDGTGLEVR